MKKVLKSILFNLILFLPTTFILAATIKDPLGDKGVQDIIEAVLDSAVAIGTPIAVIMVVFAGFKFVTAQGKPDKINEASNFLKWTLIGTAVLIGARVIAAIMKSTVEQLGAGVF